MTIGSWLAGTGILFVVLAVCGISYIVSRPVGLGQDSEPWDRDD